MKKFIILLSIIVLCTTGCQVYRFSDTDINSNIDKLMSQKTNMYNVQYDGYKYYLPKGLSFVTKDDYNAVLKDMNGNIYYLYVDVISYYHKIAIDYEVNKQSFYSQMIEYKKNNGYIQIDEYKDDNKYFVQFVYNYVKIEAYIPKDDLIEAVNNMCYVLRSVKYNDSILGSLIGDNVLNYKEEDYTLFKNSASKETYMDVVKRNENEEYSKFIEDEKIDLDY